MDIKQAKEVIQALQSAPKWLNYPENRPKKEGIHPVWRDRDINPLSIEVWNKESNRFNFNDTVIPHFMEIPEIK